jgi:hypothetical protein
MAPDVCIVIKPRSRERHCHDAEHGHIKIGPISTDRVVPPFTAYVLAANGATQRLADLMKAAAAALLSRP